VKGELLKQVKGIVINRIGDVARNGADNIFLSALIGLAAVAVYNNYFYIYTSIYGISLVIANSMAASVGNSMVKESIEKNYNDLCKFTFMFSWFTGWCTICMSCLYQPFMIIWMRGDMHLVLSNLNMFLFCIYFYAITMNNIRNQYLNGAGLFWELRVWYVLEAVGNIVLNYILGYLFGITGILVATLITIVVFNFIARTNVLFKSYFKMKPTKYYMQHILYVFVTFIGFLLTYLICSSINVTGILGLIIKALICVVTPNIVFLLAYYRNGRFKEAISFARRLVKKS
jgi:O-antigen/teichoic acid export membrane protein